jgi:hypothetical protein
VRHNQLAILKPDVGFDKIGSLFVGAYERLRLAIVVVSVNFLSAGD